MSLVPGLITVSGCIFGRFGIVAIFKSLNRIPRHFAHVMLSRKPEDTPKKS